MSDARWTEIEDDIGSAAEHFSRSVEIIATGAMSGMDLGGYMARMAFMHAMQSGHTSLETALTRVLELLGEQAPSGQSWHADLIRRASRAVDGRPAILSPELASAADQTRRFRHVAMRSYDTLDLTLADPAISAANVLARHLPAAIAAFRGTTDPD